MTLIRTVKGKKLGTHQKRTQIKVFDRFLQMSRLRWQSFYLFYLFQFYLISPTFLLFLFQMKSWFVKSVEFVFAEKNESFQFLPNRKTHKGDSGDLESQT